MAGFVSGGQDVEDWRKVDRHADGAQFARQRPGEPLGQAFVVRPTKCGHRGPLGERALQIVRPRPPS